MEKILKNYEIPEMRNSWEMKKVGKMRPMRNQPQV